MVDITAHDWWDDPASYPYHTALEQGAEESGGAVTAQELAQQIGVESSFNPDAVNKTSGASGIAQFLPSTASDPGYGISAIDTSNPYQSIVSAGAYDGAVGVSNYSGGGYSLADLDKSMTATPGTTIQGSGTTSTPTTSTVSLWKTGLSVATGGLSQFITGGTTTSSTSTSDPSVSGAKGIVGALDEYGTRITLVMVGLIFVIVGLVMLSPKSVTNTVKGAARAGAKTIVEAGA